MEENKKQEDTVIKPSSTDKLRLIQKIINDGLNNTVENTLHKLESLRGPVSDKPIKPYKPSKEQRKNDTKTIRYIRSLFEISDKLVICLSNYENKNFSKASENKCKNEIILSMGKLIEILQNIDDFKQYAVDVNPELKMLLVDVVAEILKTLTTVTTIYLNTIIELPNLPKK